VLIESELFEIPFRDEHVPHIVIEVNQKCNISCESCYKDKNTYTKPLDQLKREIALALELRKISVVTLAGGEPTLHPHLLKLISHIRSLGKDVQIASNGMTLTEEYLAELKQAQLKEIYVHIDSLQTRPDGKGYKTEKQFNQLRKVITEKISRAGIVSSLVATLYQKNLNELPDIIDFALDSKDVTRCLFTCSTDFSKIATDISSTTILGNCFRSASFSPDPSTGAEEEYQHGVSLDSIRKILKEKYNMEPVSYLGSNLDHKSARWLVYYNFVIKTPEKNFVLNIGPSFGAVVEKNINDKIGKNKAISFGKVLDQKSAVLFCLYYAWASRSLKVMSETLSFLFKLLKKDAEIHYKDFTFQQGPELHADGSFEICRSCPDATIRDGVLVPVCLADSLVKKNPLKA